MNRSPLSCFGIRRQRRSRPSNGDLPLPLHRMPGYFSPYYSESEFDESQPPSPLLANRFSRRKHSGRQGCCHSTHEHQYPRRPHQREYPDYEHYDLAHFPHPLILRENERYVYPSEDFHVRVRVIRIFRANDPAFHEAGVQRPDGVAVIPLWARICDIYETLSNGADVEVLVRGNVRGPVHLRDWYEVRGLQGAELLVFEDH